MKQLLSSILLFSLLLVFVLSSAIFAGDCKVSCRNGACEVTNCEDNATCKCSWLGNPICKCSTKGTIEEIGGVADEILKHW